MNFMLVEITKVEQEEILTASSREVAEKFKKEHKEIIYAIEGQSDSEGKTKHSGLLNQLIEGGELHPEKYFILTNYKSRGKAFKEYLMTRDGFTLLAMGFSGGDAMRWKLDYIRAFNQMEAELKRLYKERQKWEIERQKGILVRHILTDTIKMKVADSPHKKFMYPNYTKLIYKTIFGKTMKELQEEYRVKGKESIREYITSDELKQIESLELLVSSLISCGWGYDQIKNFIQENSTKMLAG